MRPQSGSTLQTTDIVITHVGYADPAGQAGKIDRNLPLLQLELQERPNDGFVLFNLGAVALEQNRAAEAVGFLQRSWEHIQPTDTLAPRLAVLLVRARHQLGQRALALMVCRNCRQRFPQEAELLFWEATLRCEQGELGGACQSLEQLLQLPAGQQLGGADAGLPWVDSFAATRNEGLKHARSHYVFWLDADDVLDEPNRQKLQQLLASLDGSNVGFVMKCHCLPDPVSQAATAVDHLRLFRRHPSLRWSFRVHEQVLGSFKAHGGEIRWSDVVIQHTGYQDRQALQRKEQRNLRLLQLDYAEDPEHPFTLFNLGSLYQGLRGPALALPLFQKSLARSAATDSIVRKLHAQIATCHQLLGQRQEALAACQLGRRHFPEDGELLFHEGQIRRGLGDLAGAENCWRQLLASQPGQHFASVHTGLRGCLTLYHLGDLYREQGRAAEAEKLWLAALEEQPGYEPAWRALQELYVQQQRWPDLEQLTHQLERFPVAAVMVRGSGLLARQEFPAAQTLLGEAVRQHPRSVELRLLWSYAFLQEGKDWAGAERALLAVLELEPHHPEAQRNLAVLRRQQRQG